MKSLFSNTISLDKLFKKEEKIILKIENFLICATYDFDHKLNVHEKVADSGKIKQNS